MVPDGSTICPPAGGRKWVGLLADRRNRQDQPPSIDDKAPSVARAALGRVYPSEDTPNRSRRF